MIEEKKLSDFQETDCKPPAPPTLDPALPCPTCIPDPNYVLSTDWWNMTTGWLDESTCEYKFNFNVKLFDKINSHKMNRHSAEWKEVRDEYAIEYAVSELLKQFNKLVNKSTKMGLAVQARAEVDYVHPEYDIENVLVTLPALALDMVPEEPLPESELTEETEESSINLSEIILVGDKIYQQIEKLRIALGAYEFYYSAFHQVKGAVISERDNPTQRINYGQAKDELSEFRDTLGDILKNNNFKRLRMFERPSFKLRELDRLKIVFNNQDEKPFNIKTKEGKYQVFAKAKNGCGDWEQLNGSYRLDKYTQPLAFLARIDDIMIDLEARETKPWLEFTLEYFYPIMTIDYGLANAPISEDDKSALACLLEKELGLGKGKVLDSLISAIISSLELFAYKQGQKACRAEEDLITDGTQRQKDLENNPDLDAAEKRKLQMIERFQKQIYNENIKELKAQIKTDENPSPSESDALKKAKEIEGLSSITLAKKHIMSRALIPAQAKWQENQASSTGSIVLSNSPFLHDAHAAIRDKVSKEDTVVDSLKENFSSVRESMDGGTFQSFLNVFGICGVSKLSGTALECLLGGITLDAFINAAIQKIFEYMEVNVFIKFYSALPFNVRLAIDEAIAEEFGNVSLTEVLEFTGEQQPSSNLRSVSGAMSAEIDSVVKMIEKYLAPAQILDATKSQKLEALGISDGVFWTFAVEEFYDHSLSSYHPVVPPPEKADVKLQNKTKRNLKRLIRTAIKKRDKDEIDAATKKFKGLIGGAKSPNRASLEDEYALAQDDQVTNMLLMLETLQSNMHSMKRELQHEYEEMALEAEGKCEDYRNGSAPYRPCELASREAERILAMTFSVEQELGAVEIARQGLLSAEEPEIPNMEKLSASYNDLKVNVKDYTTAGLDVVLSTASQAASKMSLTHDEYAKAIENYEETNIGVRLNKLIGAIILESLDLIFNFVPENDLWDMLRQFPVPDLVINVLEMLFRSCPSEPLFHPPIKKFMNTLKIDICDPSLQISWPKLVIPSLDWKLKLKDKLWETLQEVLMDLLKSLLMSMLIKILDTLMASVCKALDALGRTAGNMLKGDGIGDAWYNALDVAFCGDEDKAKELSDSIFNENRALASKANNIISGVAAQDEILTAIIAEDSGDQDQSFNTRVSNAIAALADDEPELTALLGSPSKVGFFMMKLGGFLSQDDKDRIRDLLDDGVPNLPLTAAICLTDDQYDEWNNLRNQLLQDKGLSPEDAQAQVNRLNQATEDALADIIDFSTALQDPGGPFKGPIQDWYGDPRYPNGPGPGNIDSPDDVYGDDEPCQDGTPIEDQLAEWERELENEAGEASFTALAKFIKRSYFKRGGIFNEALRDTEGKGMWGHSMRVRRNILWPNYANSQQEWQSKYDDSWKLMQLWMKSAGGVGLLEQFDEPGDRGSFPKSVGHFVKEQLEDDSNFKLDLSKKYGTETKSKNSKGEQLRYNPPGISFKKIDLKIRYPKNAANIKLSFSFPEPEPPDLPLGGKPLRKGKNRGGYDYNANALFGASGKTSFDYYSFVSSRTSPEASFATDVSSVVFVEPSDDQIKLLSDSGFEYSKDGNANIRGETFSSLMNFRNSAIAGSQDYVGMQEKLFEKILKKMRNTIIKDSSGGLSYGFKFGYQPDTLTEDDFDNYTGPDGEEYTYEESDKILGKYGSDRIVVLNPEMYGGRYSNPPIYVRPMKYDGWLDAAEAIFGGTGGCEPKTIGALTFRDIKDRGDYIKDNMTHDKRLAEDPECVAIRPFHILLMKSSHAGLEKAVRTTVRTYSCEAFLKGLGIFGNLLLSEKNYDSALAGYIIDDMKSSMMSLGRPRSSRRIRIKRNSYWYTFLEQTVQCYQRMMEVDNLKPPSHVMKALEDIYNVQRDYAYPTKARKKKFWNPSYDYKLPGKALFVKANNPDSYNMKNIKQFYHDAIAYRVHGENMFHSTDTVEFPRKRMYSLRKMRFFTKIFSIRLVEDQCRVILSELVKSEMRILATRFENAKSTPSYIRELDKAFLGFSDIFEGTSLKLGTSVATEKNIGDVPYVRDEITSLPADSSEPVLMIEKYVRIIEREVSPGISPAPDFIRTRLDKYKGVMSAARFSEFKSSIPAAKLKDHEGNDLMLSDCFGNLQFTYKIKFKSLFTPDSEGVIRSFTSAEIRHIIDLNKEEIKEEIQKSFDKHMMGEDIDDIRILITRSYMSDSMLMDNPTPAGTTGDLGIKYGLRISIVPPAGSLTIGSSIKIQEQSLHEKAYRFLDGNILLPMISAEYGAIDDSIENFNVADKLDLICLVDKITQDPLYDLYFDKIFGLTMMTSMVGLYCMFGFTPAQGKGEFDGVKERAEEDNDPLGADWFDGVSNKSLKQYLRREFSTYYLSNDKDGQQPDDSDKQEFRLGFSNPFKSLEMSLLMPKMKFFQKMKLQTNPYDGDGEECADPLKDLI